MSTAANRNVSECAESSRTISVDAAAAANALEKSKSDSKINQTALESEPMRRSNSNHQIKKSPKKTKKSKSYSKLLELDKNVSVAGCFLF